MCALSSHLLSGPWGSTASLCELGLGESFPLLAVGKVRWPPPLAVPNWRWKTKVEGQETSLFLLHSENIHFVSDSDEYLKQDGPTSCRSNSFFPPEPLTQCLMWWVAWEVGGYLLPVSDGSSDLGFRFPSAETTCALSELFNQPELHIGIS